MERFTEVSVLSLVVVVSLVGLVMLNSGSTGQEVTGDAKGRPAPLYKEVTPRSVVPICPEGVIATPGHLRAPYKMPPGTKTCQRGFGSDARGYPMWCCE